MSLELSDLNPIAPLDRTHNRAAFVCGVRSLDNYLKDVAIRDQEGNLSRVFVWTLIQDPKVVIGYYALSACQIETNNIPKEISKKLPPRTLLGATLLGKMAVSAALQKSPLKIGRRMLVDAMRQTWIASLSVSSFAMIADIRPEENGDSSAFYMKHGFQVLTESPKRLFLPITTIESFLKQTKIV